MCFKNDYNNDYKCIYFIFVIGYALMALLQWLCFNGFALILCFKKDIMFVYQESVAPAEIVSECLEKNLAFVMFMLLAC